MFKTGLQIFKLNDLQTQDFNQIIPTDIPLIFTLLFKIPIKSVITAQFTLWKLISEECINTFTEYNITTLYIFPFYHSLKGGNIKLM